MKDQDIYYDWIEVTSFFVGAIVLTVFVYLFLQL
ncbi:hypothetical protein SAMN05877842_111123 [Ureibacillus acetophenoni]|uniref:Uncharacterized protein n=1 Tax=Ureibacillus acetophenoni TaxID=614649 RepID=A0A285UP65_9BACL|nr:hypothetical protein SAMN05877842_111123 [Ureibacillus acetophenoni]